MVRKRTVIFGLIAFSVVLCLIFLRPTGKTSGNNTIDIEVTPSRSSITLDGKRVSEGKSRVPDGKHTIKVMHKGFETQEQTVEISGSEELYVGIPLSPNSSETYNWYKEHDKDKQKADAMASKTYDQNSSNMTQSNPIVAHLPLPYGQERYAIDYAPSQINNNGIIIQITAEDSRGRQYALQQIKDWGYDPTDLEIEFLDFNNPLRD